MNPVHEVARASVWGLDCEESQVEVYRPLNVYRLHLSHVIKLERAKDLNHFLTRLARVSNSLPVTSGT